MGRIGTTQVSVFVEQRILVWMNVPGREEAGGSFSPSLGCVMSEDMIYEGPFQYYQQSNVVSASIPEIDRRCTISNSRVVTNNTVIQRQRIQTMDKVNDTAPPKARAVKQRLTWAPRANRIPERLILPGSGVTVIGNTAVKDLLTTKSSNEQLKNEFHFLLTFTARWVPPTSPVSSCGVCHFTSYATPTPNTAYSWK